MRVLVADDEPDAREIVFTVLELAGATVETAASAAEAMAMLERKPPDILVSDLGMPHEGGSELMRRVRALGTEEGNAVPAVALSAYTRGEDKMRAVAAGFDVHISKPVSAEDLVAAIARLANRSDPWRRRGRALGTAVAPERPPARRRSAVPDRSDIKRAGGLTIVQDGGRPRTPGCFNSLRPRRARRHA